MSDDAVTAQLRQRLERRERELEAARRVSEAVRQQATLDEIIHAAISVAVEVVDGRAGSIMLADEATRQLRFRVSVGDNPVTTGTAIPWDQGIAGLVFHSGAPLVVPQISAVSAHLGSIDAMTGFNTQNMFALPLKSQSGSVLGVMEVLNKTDQAPNEADLSVLTIIAAFAAMSIEQARLFEAARLAEVAHRLNHLGHDIKNMLMPVLLGMGLLEHQFAVSGDATGASDPAATAANRANMEEALGMMKNAVQRVQDRVRLVTEYVRGHELPIAFVRCNLGRIVEDVFSTLRAVAAPARVALEMRGVTAIPPLNADEDRLYSALYNLVDNAIAEVPPGGSVTVSADVIDDGTTVALEVADTGRGMSAAVLESLFTDRARSRKPGGSGLGTRIVRDAVAAHHGHIEVKSELGRGTTFRISLPVDSRGTNRSEQENSTGRPGAEARSGH